VYWSDAKKARLLCRAFEFGVAALGDRGHGVAVRDDLATGDLRRVGDRRVEVLVGDPFRDEHRRTVGLLGGLEEAERAEDASAAFDQEVAGEAGELAELGYECPVACI